jgi:hypothetical protein
MSVIAIIGASSISIAGIYITQPDLHQKRSVIMLANKSCRMPPRLDSRGEIKQEINSVDRILAGKKRNAFAILTATWPSPNSSTTKVSW